jgi:carbohydrate kinase (thermoresistant glucokinase family)
VHLTVDVVMRELRVTRPMAREALQILHQKGLVNLQPRIGATVQGLGDWDLLDRDVIMWRLQEAPDSQMRSLTELREMIEPRAARLTAIWRTAEIGHDLIGLGHQLLDLSVEDDFVRPEEGRSTRQQFRDADARFHRTLLAGSRNELLLRMAHPVELALNHRIDRDWAGVDPQAAVIPLRAPIGAIKRYPPRPQPISMWFHVGLAHAVDQGQPTAAEAFAEAILAEIRHGQLDDPAVRGRLREGLNQFNVRSLRPADRPEFRRAMREIVRERNPIVVTGVAGSGKSTVGSLLAGTLGARFEEGDDLHPPQLVNQMTRGIPIDDRCRGPWLAAVARFIAAANPDEGLVLTCSALKRIYREVLRAASPDIVFVQLEVDPNTISNRGADRSPHVPSASLVASEFESFEPLEPDEAGVTVDANQTPQEIVSFVQARLAELRIAAAWSD